MHNQETKKTDGICLILQSAEKWHTFSGCYSLYSEKLAYNPTCVRYSEFSQFNEETHHRKLHLVR